MRARQRSQPSPTRQQNWAGPIFLTSTIAPVDLYKPAPCEFRSSEVSRRSPGANASSASASSKPKAAELPVSAPKAGYQRISTGSLRRVWARASNMCGPTRLRVRLSNATRASDPQLPAQLPLHTRKPAHAPASPPRDSTSPQTKIGISYATGRHLRSI